MLAVRGEFLKEDLATTQTELAAIRRARRPASSPAPRASTTGAARFARISINYVLNMWSGTSETIKTLRARGLARARSCSFASPCSL